MYLLEDLVWSNAVNQLPKVCGAKILVSDRFPWRWEKTTHKWALNKKPECSFFWKLKSSFADCRPGCSGCLGWQLSPRPGSAPSATFSVSSSSPEGWWHRYSTGTTISRSLQFLRGNWNLKCFYVRNCIWQQNFMWR